MDFLAVFIFSSSQLENIICAQVYIIIITTAIQTNQFNQFITVKIICAQSLKSLGLVQFTLLLCVLQSVFEYVAETK
jgi:hypothetical protein